MPHREFSTCTLYYLGFLFHNVALAVTRFRINHRVMRMTYFLRKYRSEKQIMNKIRPKTVYSLESHKNEYRDVTSCMSQNNEFLMLERLVGCSKARTAAYALHIPFLSKEKT